MPARSIQQVLKDHTSQLMSLPGVVGTAQGLAGDAPCIKVYVIANTPQLEEQIPKVLEGYTVVVEETGRMESLDNSD